MGSVEREADFSAYVSARQSSLARFAYLLTGGAHEAEDLVQSVLAKVYAKWDCQESPDSLASCWAVVDLTSSRFTRSVEKCGNTFLPSAFSANGTYLVGENASSGGFFSRFMIVRADTGKAVFGGGPDSADDGAGWSVRLGADERTVWLSANTSTPRFPAEANSVQQCTIGAGCRGVTPALKTPRSQPHYVVESPTSD
ncbi:sigma factor [Humibacillus sp. DSM 29435]|uniref:sigma factor n=1 Tax=Humibacillus sp. DSM 29435 TaxID=1869167 RepID=UPI0009F2C227|nr:sigma factor [Humibacillus sp. DSM 29435]